MYMLLSLRIFPTVQSSRSIFWNGLIEQWGTGITDAYGGVTINFLVAFSNKNYNIQCVGNYSRNPEASGYNSSDRLEASMRIGNVGNNEMSYKVKGY